MSTKKPQIDLSKCPIGTRLSLRNGEEVILTRKDRKKVLSYPYCTSDGQSHTKNGRVWNTKEDSRDIIAILPPAKAKKAVEPKRVGKKPDHLDPKWLEGEFDKQAIHRVIKLLKGLLKP